MIILLLFLLLIYLLTKVELIKWTIYIIGLVWLSILAFGIGAAIGILNSIL